MSLSWTARQLIAARHLAKREHESAPAYNPRPAGTIYAGSTTHRVLVAMHRRPEHWWRHEEIKRRVEMDSPQFGWSLRLLAQRGAIETAADDRNPRYLRYRITARGLSALSNN